MKADSIKVSVDRLNDFAESLCMETQVMSQAYDNIKSEYREIGGYWKSECWDEINTNFTANMQAMEDTLTKISNFEGTVRVVAGQYERTEKVNQSLPDILPANIIK